MVKSLPSCIANHLYKSPANHFRSKINELNTSKALIKYGSHQEERQ